MRRSTVPVSSRCGGRRTWSFRSDDPKMAMAQVQRNKLRVDTRLKLPAMLHAAKYSPRVEPVRGETNVVFPIGRPEDGDGASAAEQTAGGHAVETPGNAPCGEVQSPCRAGAGGDERGLSDRTTRRWRWRKCSGTNCGWTRG